MFLEQNNVLSFNIHIAMQLMQPCSHRIGPSKALNVCRSSFRFSGGTVSLILASIMGLILVRIYFPTVIEER